MLDLNVVLDVLLKRELHFRDSALILDLVAQGKLTGYLPTHGITTIYYLTKRYDSVLPPETALRWLLELFTIAPAGAPVFERALDLGFDDFEDAVVSVSAEEAGCQAVISRNSADFGKSPVAALSPSEFLAGNL